MSVLARYFEYRSTFPGACIHQGRQREPRGLAGLHSSGAGYGVCNVVGDPDFLLKLNRAVTAAGMMRGASLKEEGRAREVESDCVTIPGTNEYWAAR